jgi:hypothetical protein
LNSAACGCHGNSGGRSCNRTDRCQGDGVGREAERRNGGRRQRRTGALDRSNLLSYDRWVDNSRSQSTPITATGAAIIPLRVRADARPRLHMELLTSHSAALDREVQGLIRQDFRTAGEWARQAATPIVRTDCIVDLLIAGTSGLPAVTTDEAHRQAVIAGLCDELQLALSEIAKLLARLGDLAAGPEERDSVLDRLAFDMMLYQRVLGLLAQLAEL